MLPICFKLLYEVIIYGTSNVLGIDETEVKIKLKYYKKYLDNQCIHNI